MGGMQSAEAHSVQMGYCVLNNGFIRVYIEHWHGDQSLASLNGNTINVTTQVGASTVVQNINATGFANNTNVNSLPGCGSNFIVLSTCSGQANTRNDWAYWDFAPAACNVPISIRINSGNTVVFQEACGNLFPQTVNATFNDNAGPVLTCPDVNVY